MAQKHLHRKSLSFVLVHYGKVLNVTCTVLVLDNYRKRLTLLIQFLFIMGKD